MLPYFPQPRLHLFGPVYLHAFGAMVAAALIAGWRMAAARCRGKGLDERLFERLAVWVVAAGFLGAHLYSVLAYFPREAAENPLLLLKAWENISSFGGIAGGVLGYWLFFRFKGRQTGYLERLEYLDAIAYAFPFAWVLGRLGCTLAHDHPGVVTSFPLAFSLESAEAREYILSVYAGAGRLSELPSAAELAGMGFHDLGWYELLYTLLLMVPAFLLMDRRKRVPGFYPLAFILLYVPARFLLDFLRLADATYFGLTPGQYAGAAVFAAALPAAWILRRGKRLRPGAGGL